MVWLWHVSDSRFFNSKRGKKNNSTERCLSFYLHPMFKINIAHHHCVIIVYFSLLILSYGIYRQFDLPACSSQLRYTCFPPSYFQLYDVTRQIFFVFFFFFWFSIGAPRIFLVTVVISWYRSILGKKKL